MANTDGKRAANKRYVRFSLRLSVDDATWINKEAQRLSPDDAFRGRLTLSDVIRKLVRGGRNASK